MPTEEIKAKVQTEFHASYAAVDYPRLTYQNKFVI
jgi:hypothetical protein